MQTDAGSIGREASTAARFKPRPVGIVIAGTAALALTAAHIALSRLTLQQTTLLAPLDSLFTVTLVLSMLTLAWALGSRLLRRTTIVWNNAAERMIFSTAVGLGILAYTVMALAFFHFLYAPLLVALAGASVVLLRSEIEEIGAVVKATLARLPRASCRQFAPVSWIFGGGVLLLAIQALLALLPPFGYDALWYHLTAPRAFLQQHSFVVLPAIGQAGFPFTVEMLYTVCLAFASDAAPALLHLACAVLAIFGVWSFGARYFDRRAGWLAVAAMLTATDLHKLSTQADIDLALMLFEFLAVYALLVWLDRRDPGWLLLAAAMAGRALGSKYTALALLAPLGLLLLFANGSGWRSVRGGIRPLAAFVVCALLIASPWYLKNIVLFHNPLYPFLSSPYVDRALAIPSPPASLAPAAPGLLSLALLPLHVLQSASGLALTGRGLADYLQLPLQVYLRGDLEMNGQPSVLFLLAPLVLLFDRRPVVLRLLFIALLMSVLWALGPQELRYLVPAFPIFALLSGAALLWLAGRCRSVRATRLVVLLPVLCLLTVPLAEDINFFRFMQPVPVLAGLESKDAFLRRVVTSYAALSYLGSVIQPGQRALALGESRTYYATFPFITDGSRDLARRVFVDAGSPATVDALLTHDGIAYIIVNDDDMKFQAAVAPTQVRQAMAAFHQFQQQYLTEVYRDAPLHVYRIIGDRGKA